MFKCADSTVFGKVLCDTIHLFKYLWRINKNRKDSSSEIVITSISLCAISSEGIQGERPQNKGKLIWREFLSNIFPKNCILFLITWAVFLRSSVEVSMFMFDEAFGFFPFYGLVLPLPAFSSKTCKENHQIYSHLQVFWMPRWITLFLFFLYSGENATVHVIVRHFCEYPNKSRLYSWHFHVR